MKTLKILAVLLAGLFSFSAANAGEMTVTGSMQATYQSETQGFNSTTGNPLGLNTDLTFTGSTEVLDGTAVTWTMGTDGTFLGDSGADHTLAFATNYGTITVGNTGDSADAVDDITPSAFEEANGSGSGTYSNDVGFGSGSMSLKYSNADLFGTGVAVSYSHYPKLDSTTNNEKASSANASATARSASSFSIASNLAKVPFIGDTAIGNLKVTVGYNETENSVANAPAVEGGTIALNYAMGPVSLGYQKKAYQVAGTAASSKEFYKDDVLGIAFAVNDAFAISYNVYTSDRHNNSATVIEQETKAINAAYTVGGLTIALQDAQTDNASYTSTREDNTRTISIKTAF
jgi:predicted porin